MPYVAKSVEDAVRAYDPNLALLFDQGIERWTVVRFKAAGEYQEVFRIETPNGEFMEPRIEVVQRLFQNDLARIPGATHAQKITNLLNAQEKENQEILDRQKAASTSALQDRMREWEKAGRRIGADPELLERHMSTDMEQYKDVDMTDRQRRRLEEGRRP